jgi:hypothetical protein
MAKYRANPVIVDAHVILLVSTYNQFKRGHELTLDNGDTVLATDEMLARHMTVPGDYWVRQADGYVYINPREVFERKYSKIEDEDAGRSQPA